MRGSHKKVDTNEFRLRLTNYLTKNIGETIYITKYNILVGELKAYTSDMRKEAELKIARKMLKNEDQEKEVV